jgi:DNA-binding CsgD family transcriptional regulator
MQPERRIRIAGSVADFAAGEPQDRPIEEVQRLIRNLVAHVDATGIKHSHQSESDAKDDIIFAVEVDGIQFVLSRVRPPVCTLALTPRELEIARMIGNGLSDKAIATVLEISRYTVSTHLRRMYAKVGVTSRAALVAKTLARQAARS